MVHYGWGMGASNDRWMKALMWDKESRVRAMPTSENPYRTKPKVNVGGADVFFKLLDKKYSVRKMFGWTYYYEYYSEPLEGMRRTSSKGEKRNRHTGWYKYSRKHGSENESCFVMFDKYSDQTINLKIGYTIEEHRRKGLMKEFCNEVIFPIVDEVNHKFERGWDYENLLVGSHVHIICTANPLVCLNFPKTYEEEQEWDWSRDVDGFYWELYDESAYTLDNSYPDEAKLTQAQADAVWEAIGFTPDESKKKYVSIGSFGYESEQDFLMARSKKIGRFPKVYPPQSAEEKWPCQEPLKEPEK